LKEVRDFRGEGLLGAALFCSARDKAEDRYGPDNC
jgi:hypothetical protein